MTSPTTSFLLEHVELLRSSYQHWTGQTLLPGEYSSLELAHALDEAPFALVSHGTEPDPRFNYGNHLALRLFEMTWDEFTALPSRLSAEIARQEERQHLLEQVGTQGYSHGYSGVRISKTGQRFMILDATIWNLIDEQGQYRGQAALIRAWRPLSTSSDRLS